MALRSRTWQDVGLQFGDRSATGTLYITATGGLSVDAITMVGGGVGAPSSAAQSSTGPTRAAQTEGEQ